MLSRQRLRYVYAPVAKIPRQRWCLLLVTAVTAAHGSTVLDECVPGPWGAWGECRSSQCQGLKGSSWHASESSAWDEGRDAMQLMMRVKEMERAERAECLAAGTCPLMAERPSQGPVPCVNNMAGDLACRNIDQMSFVNFQDLGFVDESILHKAGSDIWGWTDPLSGDEYAIITLTGGTSFVRITDPANPVTVGWLPSNGGLGGSMWRDAKTIGNYAYIVAEVLDHGMQIFDLTRLRDLNSLQNFNSDDIILYQGFGNSHNIVADPETGYVYSVGQNLGQATYPNLCSGGLHSVDVRDPKNPQFAGCYGADGYTHDAQCIIYTGPDHRYQNKEICFAYNEDSLTIVDVHNKQNMQMISKVVYEGMRYSHQGWVTKDQTFLLLDDELDEYLSTGDGRYQRTYIWDITDLENPVEMNVYIASFKAIDHNQYIVEDYTYQANYESGLRVLHIDRANYALNEVAYFDVKPGEPRPAYFGAWSVYPFFESGNIVVSSIDYGLFVLRPQSAKMAAEAHLPYSQMTRSRDLLTSATTCPVTETMLCESPVTC